MMKRVLGIKRSSNCFFLHDRFLHEGDGESVVFRAFRVYTMAQELKVSDPPPRENLCNGNMEKDPGALMCQDCKADWENEKSDNGRAYQMRINSQRGNREAGVRSAPHK